ncbi:hypothetical protein Nepgr_008832 [Nepenthes gracilis]|uniref:BURP domain-containing protein n=1 Tax=Nepenthes gracilis TaxID=150966 RepID=A0AAD3SA66_NEPGR|nr:hypothetical protein Nepgr_008832 [Nepenthes gracilis]
MAFRLLQIFTFLSVAVFVVGHADPSPETYWKRVLPNTPLPKAVEESLHPEWLEDKSTSVDVGHGNVGVHTNKPAGGGTSVNVGHGDVGVHTSKPAGGGTSVNVGHGSVGVQTNKPGHGGTAVHVGDKGGVGVSTGKSGHGTNVHVGKGGVYVGTGPKGKPVHVYVHPGPSPFVYNYAATEAQLHDDPRVAFFFLEKDLSPGTKMNVRFSKTTNGAVFLPRLVADSIPFSSEKIPAILDRFSVEPESQEAEIMKQTIKECEEKGIKGEDKYCATSLESMVDYATSKLGKSVKVISTESDRESGQQKFVVAGAKKIAASEAVVCHKQNYAYAVFYCHRALHTEAYQVALVGQDGTKVKAAAVCHKDTSLWNPKHVAFQVLHVRPGSVPVCHFLPEDHVVWVSSPRL